MSDPTRHFDAPRAKPPRPAFLALVRARPGVVVAMTVAAAIVGEMAVGVFAADRTAGALIDSAVAATAIVVQLDPRASAIDADALGPRIKAMPPVADATLTSRDAALKALVANGLPASDGRNPLPDVWTVRLRPPASAEAPWATVVADLRRALAALPQVESVRVDERWVATLDRAAAAWFAWHAVVRRLLYLVLAILLACVGFVGGRALTAATADKRGSALALVATLVIVGASLVDLGATALLGAQSTFPGVDGLALPASLQTAGVVLWALSAMLVSSVVAALAMLWGARAIDSERTLPDVTVRHRNY